MARMNKNRRGYKGRKRYARKYISKRKAVRRAKKSNFAKAVLSVIAKEAETKQAFTSSGSSLIFYNAGINSTGDMLSALPSIGNGTADNQKLGDQIRAQSLNMKGYIKLNVNTTATSSTLPNVVARLFVVSLKTKPNFTEAISSATPLNGLLKKGGTTSAFTGVLSDIYAPVNTDLWTVHADRKFYLNQSYISNYGSVVAQQIPMDVKNTVKFFNINIRCKNKLLKYDANISSGLLPTNFGPIILLGYAYLDGSAPDTLSTNLGLHYDNVFNYQDM